MGLRDKSWMADYLFSSEETTLLDVWVDSAIIWQWLARIRQSATMVFLLQAIRNEFPALFVGQRMIPLHGRKLLVALESLVLTGVTSWLFFVSWRALQMHTRHVKNARRIRSSAI